MTNSKNSPWRNEALLREKYVGAGLDTYQIAEEFGCSAETVRTWLEKYDVERRAVHDYHDDGWKDEAWLREQYINQDLKSTEIAEQVGVHRSTVSNVLREFGIRDEKVESETPWRSKKLLERLYVEEQRTTIEIANRLGCSNETISYWLRKHDISTRMSLPHFHTNAYGYEYIRHTVNGELAQVPVHRLVAVATGVLDADKLKDSSVVVHHRNNISWDNRPKNLEAMDSREHSSIHNSKGYKPEEI